MRNLLFAVMIAFVSTAWAQTDSQPAQPDQTQQPTQQPAPPQPTPSVPPPATDEAANPVTQNLNWLVGEWNGSGTQNGQTFEAHLSVKPQLDGNALLLERTSPSGYKELMVIAYDKTSQKVVATLFTSQNNSGIYVANAAPNQVTFSQVTSVQGAVSERVLQQTPDGQLKMIVRGANPGEQPKTMIEITFTKG